MGAIKTANSAKEALWAEVESDPARWSLSEGVGSTFAERLMRRLSELYRGAVYATSQGAYVTRQLSASPLLDRWLITLRFLYCHGEYKTPRQLSDACRNGHAESRPIEFTARLDSLDETKMDVVPAADSSGEGIGFAVIVQCLDLRPCVDVISKGDSGEEKSVAPNAFFPCADDRMCRSLVGTLRNYVSLVKAGKIVDDNEANQRYLEILKREKN